MVKIRMRRVGKKNSPYYRIVATDMRSPRDGRFLEILGTYDPKKKDVNFQVDLERVKFWLQRGAQPSDTVRSILKRAEKMPLQPAVA